jgi:hypothetical protein
LTFLVAISIRGEARIKQENKMMIWLFLLKMFLIRVVAQLFKVIIFP